MVCSLFVCCSCAHCLVSNKRRVGVYSTKRRNKFPPHIFSIAEGSYSSMCLSKFLYSLYEDTFILHCSECKNQSILITGKSGACKTENTKKVITYFAFVCSFAGKKAKGGENKKASLEDHVVQTKQVLKAYGNTKYKLPNERDYHIFYFYDYT